MSLGYDFYKKKKKILVVYFSFLIKIYLK